MVWDPTQPRENAPVLSAPIRANWEALDIMIAGLDQRLDTIEGGSTGFPNPMTQAGDIIVGAASGTAVRLPAGSDTQVLTLSGGTPTWQSPVPSGMSNPMTAVGDLIVGSTAGAPVRLAKGSDTQVLTLVSGQPAWQAPASAGMTNPMTAKGDLITADTGGVSIRLATSVNSWAVLQGNHLGTGLPAWTTTPKISTLTIRHSSGSDAGSVTAIDGSPGPGPGFIGADGKTLAWLTNGYLEFSIGAPPTGLSTVPQRAALYMKHADGIGDFYIIDSSLVERKLATNPMTTQDDLIRGGVGGVPERLGRGVNGQVLMTFGSIVSWRSFTIAPGDLIFGHALSGSTPTQLPIGSAGQVLTVVDGVPAWATLPVDPGFANPMTAVGDLIRGGTSGAPTRLAAGTNGHWLTLSGGIPTWSALPVDPGFANPMTAAGDVIVGGASGAATRLGKGADTQVLTLVSGTPAWATPASGGMTNPMTDSGDIIIGGASGTATRLAKGTDADVLTLVSGAPAWQAASAGGGVTWPLLPPSDNTSDIGSGALSVRDIYADGRLILGADAILQRDAANTLAMINGTNIQTLRLYYTGAATYFRLAISGNSIITESNGANAGSLTIGAGTGANSLSFQTGATTRWGIDNTGTLRPTGGTYSIGDGSFKIGDIYLSSSSNLIGPGSTAFLYRGVVSQPQVATYSASITPVATQTRIHITVTNATAFTINAPTSGQAHQLISFLIKNTSGGAHGTITWGGAYRVASPAFVVANGSNRTISFYYDGTTWTEMWRSAADVPN